MTTRAQRRAAYEARLWRLAFLLTGDAAGALAVTERVLRRRPDLSRVAPDRLDRLVLLHAREWAGAGGPRPRRGTLLLDPAAAPTAARRVLDAAVAMPRQSLEAWALTRIDDLGEIAVARAMDCSKAAAARSLTHADQTLRAALGDALAPGVEALRAFAAAMDPAPFLVVARRRRRRRRMGRLLLAAGLLAASAAGVAAALLW